MMKVILEIQKNKFSFFMELIKSLDFINVVKEVKDEQKSQIISDLAHAFEEVKEFEKGNLKLKSAKDLIDEL